MFDITSSKLLILGIVALLVIGPKDLPALLRTIGKYMGIIKRQAAEFRAQFDEAMRESELSELKKSVESIQQETETTMREATSSVEKQLEDARQSVDGAMDEPKPVADPMAYQVDGPPDASADASAPASTGAPAELNGSSHPAETSAEASAPAATGVPSEPVGAPPAAETPGEPGRATEKSGA
jgi:sec-independent protein translocase protein TatB